jgi:hypothetical protein
MKDEEPSFILHPSSFILSNVVFGLFRKVIHCPLHPPAPLLDVAVARDDDRLTVEEDHSCERPGDDHPIPGRQQLFFLAANAMGTIGRPVACAATTIPSFATRAGPRGPSGVNTMLLPLRADRIRPRNPAIPPRVDDPREVATP